MQNHCLARIYPTVPFLMYQKIKQLDTQGVAREAAPGPSAAGGRAKSGVLPPRSRPVMNQEEVKRLPLPGCSPGGERAPKSVPPVIYS